MFPEAEIKTDCNSSSVVKIECGATKIVEVPQRDLYRKYRWPAEPKIKQHLELFKEMDEN